MTPEEKIDFILTMLKHNAELKPDYKAAAVEVGISRSDNAATKFKKIIEETGKFLYTKGKVTGIDSTAAPATPTKKIPSAPQGKTQTPKTPKEASKMEPAVKKRKIATVQGENDSQAINGNVKDEV